MQSQLGGRFEHLIFLSLQLFIWCEREKQWQICAYAVSWIHQEQKEEWLPGAERKGNKKKIWKHKLPYSQKDSVCQFEE